jgi:hypothetical protein
VLSLIGLVGLIWCIFKVSSAKKSQQDDAAMRATLRAVMSVNLAALFLSVIGLMMVIVGIFLG